MDSILDSVKKVLNQGEDDDFFDPDILMHINTVFSTLHQLGVGPEDGFAIEDDAATWDDFLDGDKRFNLVKTYVYLRVRLLFDPPTSGYAVEAVKEQIKEHEWRISVVREGDAWVPGTI